MNAAPEKRYRTERGDSVADRERILALWERCGFASGESARARYDWFYLANPAGPSRVYLLFSGEEMVGALGAGTRQLAGAAGAVCSAAILVDFVVEPAHRALYPAVALQRWAREREFHDLHMIYGIPAAKAIPVFRRMGATTELSCGNHARVLRSARFLRRLLPWMPRIGVRVLGAVIDRARLVLPWLICRFAGVRSQWQPDLPTGLESLTDAAHGRQDCAMGIRDRRFLEWRFSRARGEEWQVLQVTGRRGRLIACFICLHEGEELHVHDLLIGDPSDSFVALQALALAGGRSAAESVRIAFGGCTRMQRTLASAGFLLRDQRTCFLVKAPGLDVALPTQWWLTRADEDV